MFTEKGRVAIQAFREELGRLDRARDALRNAEVALIIVQYTPGAIIQASQSPSSASPFPQTIPRIGQPDDAGTEGFGLSQHNLVDKTKSYFESVYAVCGSLMSTLQEVAPNSFSGQMPRWSVHKWLGFMEGRFPALGAELQMLRRARELRTLLAHPQKDGKPYTWYTYAYETAFRGKTVVPIFYAPGTGLIVPAFSGQFSSDPYDANHRPPLDCDWFMVTPPYVQVNDAFHNVAQKVLAGFGIEI